MTLHKYTSYPIKYYLGSYSEHYKHQESCNTLELNCNFLMSHNKGLLSTQLNPKNIHEYM